MRRLSCRPAGLLFLCGISCWVWAQERPALRGFTADHSAAQRALEQELHRQPRTDQIRLYHRILTEEPHVAGTAGGKRVADYILQEFQRHGIQSEMVEYDVLLSYPREVSLSLVVPEQKKLANSEEGYPGDKDSYDPRVDPPWHAYAASGQHQGQVVYVNYGRREDYQQLDRMGVDYRGKIALARYFQGYRGGKSLEAEQRGVAALIIYSDPAEDGYVKGDTYPDGPWGPPSHVQRGANVYDFRVPGDPLTPGWASTAGARRIAESESEVLPKIATLPISYADAQHILRNLAGAPVPAGWQGGLPFTYHVGPGPAEVFLNQEISRERRKIYDVIGKIPGRSHPEQVVILSNHHDAWVYGGVDPSSGTAVLLELARVLGQMQREGWKPERTLLLGAWDAEEYTLTGSTEYGEEHAEALRQNAVACLNVDAASSGDRFSASAVPSLRRFIVEATRDIQDPAGGRSIYHRWVENTEAQNVRGYGVDVGGSYPVPIGILGSGSDYTVFFNFLGIPSIDMLFDGPYGVYHSLYDNHFWVDRFGDPGFHYHRAMVTLWATMATRLANADVLPFDYLEYARDFETYTEDLRKLAGSGLQLQELDDAIASFRRAAERVEGILDRAARGDQDPGRAAFNQALLRVERDLTHPDGLPGRPWFKHLIYAPLPSYRAETFPGVREALLEQDRPRAQGELERLSRAIRQAAATLDRIR